MALELGYGCECKLKDGTLIPLKHSKTLLTADCNSVQ